MKQILVALALVLLALPAYAQTPTPVTAATASADEGQVRNRQRPSNGGDALQNPMTFEGGAQIGTTAAGASLYTFSKRGTCLVDPSASLGDGAETIVSCAATGAAAGDLVLGAIATTSDVSDVYIKRATAFTDSVQFSIGSYTAAQNPGDLEIRFLVLR